MDADKQDALKAAILQVLKDNEVPPAKADQLADELLPTIARVLKPAKKRTQPRVTYFD